MLGIRGLGVHAAGSRSHWGCIAQAEQDASALDSGHGAGTLMQFQLSPGWADVDTWTSFIHHPMRTVLVLLCASSSQLHPSATHHHPFACLTCA